MVSGSRVAIIPARGGSKRIPHKNIVSFAGKPMIAWTIEAALKAETFDRIFVSTDDERIAEVAIQYGASVPFLRSAHADDQSPVSAATIAALKQLSSEANENYELVVQLMANCPLRTTEHILKSLERFEQAECSALVTCFKFGWMNPWWAATLSPDGRPSVLFPESMKARSQDLPPLYCPSGAIWIARVSALLSAGTFHTDDRIYYPIGWEAAIDIDDSDDLHMAECLRRMSETKS